MLCYPNPQLFMMTAGIEQPILTVSPAKSCMPVGMPAFHGIITSP
jgi:hypothetical protein